MELPATHPITGEVAFRGGELPLIRAAPEGLQRRAYSRGSTAEGIPRRVNSFSQASVGRHRSVYSG
eukprot:134190-Alexandrium_andersonii.AAC.1